MSYTFWIALGFHLGHVSVLFTTCVACIARFVFLLAFCRRTPSSLFVFFLPEDYYCSTSLPLSDPVP